jgi:hypothetical protein
VTPVDLDRLRALRSGPDWCETDAHEWDRLLGECFAELEAARRNVANLQLVLACVAPEGEPIDAAKCGSCRNCIAEERDALRAEVEKLRKGLAAVEALISESKGVCGLHLNGDDAPWTELRTEGRFEEWLVDFDAALDADHHADRGPR